MATSAPPNQVTFSPNLGLILVVGCPFGLPFVTLKRSSLDVSWPRFVNGHRGLVSRPRDVVDDAGACRAHDRRVYSSDELGMTTTLMLADDACRAVQPGWISHVRSGPFVDSTSRILAWLQAVGSAAVFVFVNYFDAHDPYEMSADE